MSIWFDRFALSHANARVSRLQSNDQQRHFCDVCGTTLFWNLSN